MVFTLLIDCWHDSHATRLQAIIPIRKLFLRIVFETSLDRTGNITKLSSKIRPKYDSEKATAAIVKAGAMKPDKTYDIVRMGV